MIKTRGIENIYKNLGTWEEVVAWTWVLAEGMESGQMWVLAQGQNWPSLVIYWKGDEGEGGVKDNANVLTGATELILVLFIDVANRRCSRFEGNHKLNLVHTVCGRLQFSEMLMPVYRMGQK